MRALRCPATLLLFQQLEWQQMMLMLMLMLMLMMMVICSNFQLYLTICKSSSTVDYYYCVPYVVSCYTKGAKFGTYVCSH